jgi:hypothetical protein
MKLTEFITDVGRPVAFYPGLRKITGATTATLFLCQLIYWEGKQKDPNGWIYKVSNEIEEETGLSWQEQKTARNNLVKLGFIEEVYKRLDHVITFRLHLDKINQAWDEYNRDNKNSPIRESTIGETVKVQLGNDEKYNSLSTTENTSETTIIEISTQGILESVTGIPVTDVNSLLEIEKLEPIKEDIQEAYKWLCSKKEFKYYGQLIGPIQTAMNRRLRKKPEYETEAIKGYSLL